ncbi:hypothetical protein Poli38472_000153 [Pythium oligandrum]|uniref:Sucrose transporter n=1 Tax=Pythium oligandrum TaxID=41045 RepID=A0A8K1CB80_PYTOL|nr:hypothetical protein Poli38472_000153 [Pythium oligandrum]|eukprot:TMW60111.1 hypothetical protein Poli38472_000153 [Pythium oligandrum]
MPFLRRKTEPEYVFQGTPSYDPVGSPPNSTIHEEGASIVSVHDDGVPVKSSNVTEEDEGGFHAHGCSVAMLVLLSLPRMAINMAWAAQWAALGPYLGTLLPRFAVQLTQVIGPLCGILVAPTIGVLSDRSVNKWGRRRPFLLYGAVASAICWTLMGFTRQMGEALGDSPGHHPWTAGLTILFYTWMDITVNVVQTPAFLIIADFAGDRQTLGAGIGQASSTLGSILVAGYIQFFGAAHLTLRWFLGMLSVTMILTVGAVCVFAKEVPRAKETQDPTRSTCSRILDAFQSIVQGLRTLPRVLVVYCVVFFCVMYGYTAYNGSKGQFFGIEVYKGSPEGADTCGNACSPEQRQYDRGVQVAGGLTDLGFNILGYIYSWVLPLLVRRLGARWVVTLALIPQTLLIAMAFSEIVALDVTIVILTSITQATVFALLVPVILHVFGETAEVGMYVGALNSANCFGQLLNFVVGAALVETSLGYRLPVLVGGVFSLLGALVSLTCFKIRMYSM